MRKKICFLIALYRTSNSYILLECTDLAFMAGPFIKFMVESTIKVRNGNTILPYS